MNWDKAEQLLNIADKARHWPLLKGLHDAAMGELVDMARPKSVPTDVRVSGRGQVPDEVEVTQPVAPPEGDAPAVERRV